MTKKEIRDSIRLLRSGLTSEEATSRSEQICTAVSHIPPLHNALTTLLYLPLPKEVNPLPLTELKHINFFAPRMRGYDLDIVAFNTHSTLQKGEYNIMEPTGDAMPSTFEPDIIVIPGVAFDKKGNRVGYGKGFYDRLLSRCKQSIFIGLCFDFQMVDAISDTEPHDIGMHYIVTETQVIKL